MIDQSILAGFMIGQDKHLYEKLIEFYRAQNERVYLTIIRDNFL